MLFWIEDRNYYINGHKVSYSKLPVALKRVFDEVNRFPCWQIRTQVNPHCYSSRFANGQVITVSMSPVIHKDVSTPDKLCYLKEYYADRDGYYTKWWGAKPIEMVP